MRIAFRSLHKITIGCTVASSLILLSHSACADVQMYGLLDIFTGSKTGIGKKNSNNVVDNGGMTTSFLGVRGGEKLDSDVSVNFALEAFFRLDEGQLGRFNGDLPFARNAYLEIKSNTYGGIRLGRNTTPLFVSTVVYNPFSGSYNFSPMTMNTYTGNGYATGKHAISGVIGDSGWSNSVMYSTPSNLGGFSGSLIYSLGENGNKKEDKWGASLGYRNGDFASMAVFQQVKLNGQPSFATKSVSGFLRQDTAQLGLSYDFKAVKVFGQYQYIHNRIKSGDTYNHGGQLGVSVPAGGGKALASYMYNHTSGNHDFKDLTRHSWGVGYSYPLSKRTDVYAAYYNDKVTELSHGRTAGVGMQIRY